MCTYTQCLGFVVVGGDEFIPSDFAIFVLVAFGQDSLKNRKK